MLSNNFQAASFDIASTEFKFNLGRMTILGLAAAIGGLVGIIYVLVKSAINRRNACRNV